MSKDRAVAICFNRGAVLVMRRRKNGREYTVLPGGGVEDGEDASTGALRELLEETGLSGTLVRHLTTIDHSDRTAHYFHIEVPLGPMLVGGPESEMQSVENHYSPVWLHIAELDREPILPEEARAIIRDAAKASQ